MCNRCSGPPRHVAKGPVRTGGQRPLDLVDTTGDRGSVGEPRRQRHPRSLFVELVDGEKRSHGGQFGQDGPRYAWRSRVHGSLLRGRADGGGGSACCCSNPRRWAGLTSPCRRKRAHRLLLLGFWRPWLVGVGMPTGEGSDFDRHLDIDEGLTVARPSRILTGFLPPVVLVTIAQPIRRGDSRVASHTDAGRSVGGRGTRMAETPTGRSSGAVDAPGGVTSARPKRVALRLSGRTPSGERWVRLDAQRPAIVRRPSAFRSRVALSPSAFPMPPTRRTPSTVATVDRRTGGRPGGS